MKAGVPIAAPSSVIALIDGWKAVASWSHLGPPVAGADDLGEPPVDHQGLAVRAEHDVGGLEIAVDHAPAVGVGHRVADVEEPSEQRLQGAGALAGREPAGYAAWNPAMASLRLSPRMSRIA